MQQEGELVASECHLNVRRLRRMGHLAMNIRLSAGYKIYGALAPGVYRIGPRTVAKIHGTTRLAEARTMRFIETNTSIPVPRVLDVYLGREGQHCIVMEYIKGETLLKVWRRFSVAEKNIVLSQLKDYLLQMRALPPSSPGAVQAVDGNALYDCRLNDGPIGPFSSVEEFQQWLGYDYLRTTDRYPDLRPHFEACFGRSYRTVFTHADLGPQNIIVRGTRITGIIDWGTSGWYPEYWEYTRNYQGAYDKTWRSAIVEALDPYPDELEEEEACSKVFVRLP